MKHSPTPHRKGLKRRRVYLPADSELPGLPLWAHIALALAFLGVCAFLVWNAVPK